jgi:hypothetical protein
LLSLLPNLLVLDLPAEWLGQYIYAIGRDKLEIFLNQLAVMASDASKPSAALSKLKAVESTDTGRLYHGVNVNYFDMLLRFKTLSRFSISHSSVGLWGGTYSEQCQRFANLPLNNLEVLEMAACRFSAAEISKVLSTTPHLRVFKFSFEEQQPGRADWEPGLFVSKVEEQVGETLEELSLSIHRLLVPGNTYITEALAGVGARSLKGCKRLRHLELDTRLLLGNTYSQDVAGAVHLRLFYGRANVPGLADLLPSSICTVKLLASDDGQNLDCLRTLSKDFVQQKSEKLPDFAEFEIRCSKRGGGPAFGKYGKSLGWDGIMDSFKSVPQFTFTIAESEAHGYPESAFMGNWKKKVVQHVGMTVSNG